LVLLLLLQLKPMQLTMKLGQVTRLMPGDALVLKSNQKQLADKMLDGAFFSGNVTVSSCSSYCTPPEAKLDGPTVRVQFVQIDRQSNSNHNVCALF
jgi:hypothetical protein